MSIAENIHLQKDGKINSFHGKLTWHVERIYPSRLDLEESEMKEFAGQELKEMLYHELYGSVCDAVFNAKVAVAHTSPELLPEIEKIKKAINEKFWG